MEYSHVGFLLFLLYLFYCERSRQYRGKYCFAVDNDCLSRAFHSHTVRYGQEGQTLSRSVETRIQTDEKADAACQYDCNGRRDNQYGRVRKQFSDYAACRRYDSQSRAEHSLADFRQVV